VGRSPSASPNATVEAATNPNSPRPFVPLTEAGDPASTPETKPADIGLESLSVPIGTPLEEIRRAADAFGLDFSFMRTIAKIESDFNPEQRTGSYIGLFQLSRREFARYGSGEITNPRDNAVAAAYKFTTEAALFESDTHRKPTFSDLYLIHQQGWQGAAEHVSEPDRIAWKSMCATAEGRQKGEKWCKRAIWLNTLPTIKHLWKSVNKLTSGAFVDMLRERIDRLYARYSEALPKEPAGGAVPGELQPCWGGGHGGAQPKRIRVTGIARSIWSVGRITRSARPGGPGQFDLPQLAASFC
jgi:hypothetical protein